MTMHRRSVLAALAATALAPMRAQAQTFPNRTIRIIVPFPPGGAPDLVGRTLANRLSERLGQPFVVENRTGAGGNIAAEAVAKAAPDGYTLLATSDGPLVINPSVYPSMPFNTLRDFTPISIAASAGLVLMAYSAGYHRNDQSRNREHPDKECDPDSAYSGSTRQW